MTASDLDLDALCARPVPSSAAALVARSGYRDRMTIDFDQDLASEPCLDVRRLNIAGANYYHLERNPPYDGRIPGSIPELYLRQTVIAKLTAVNRRLANCGLELYVYDAWRPQAVQRHFHDVWFPQWLRTHRPELSGEALIDEVEKYWSAPSSGASSPSPHATGGAIDLTLVDVVTHQPLYMGGIFDDLTAQAWTDYFELSDVVSMSDHEARANRRLLYWLMRDAGFVNNPTEWWHYSWGDQMWATLSGAPVAVFGAWRPVGGAA